MFTFKIFVAVSTLSFILMATSMFDTVVQPEVSSQLALEQFADPSIETDTTLRVWNQYMQMPYLLFGWGIGALILFYTDIMGQLRIRKESES